MCICFHTQYLLTGSISIRTETPKVNISHRECSTEYMAVRPSTFATSVSWRELEMTETETWQTFQKIKQKKLSVQYASLYISSLGISRSMHGTSSRWTWRRRCLPAQLHVLGNMWGNHFGLKAHFPSANRFLRKEEFQVSNAFELLFLTNIRHRHRTTKNCSLLWWWPRWRLSHRWSGQLRMHKKSTLVLECLFWADRGEGGGSGVPSVKKPPNLM